MFSPDSLAPILSGQKTQTRRLQGLHRINREKPHNYRYDGFDSSKMIFRHIANADKVTVNPIAKPGDTIWVREMWATHPRYNNIRPLSIAELIKQGDNIPIYFGDELIEMLEKGTRLLLRKSVHLPQSLSRIRLEVTEVTAQRVNYISPEDARAEGIRIVGDKGIGDRESDQATLDEWRRTWDSMYAEPRSVRSELDDHRFSFPSRGHNYMAQTSYGYSVFVRPNPWVQVIKFHIKDAPDEV